jgi:GTP cyclohydrolase IA
MSKKKPQLPGMAKKMTSSRLIGKAPATKAKSAVAKGIDGYSRMDVYDTEVLDRIGAHYSDILKNIGEDPSREGLQKTPERVAKALQYLTHGYDVDPAAILEGAIFHEAYSQMVIVKDIEVYSLCEHHMLPFFGKAHVAYIPDGRITGLSKIPRVVDAFARRLQVQERLTNEIRDCIHNTLKPLGVAVVMECDHLCMRMRGVQKQNSVTTTSAFTGIFLSDHRSREEFIKLISSRLH